jgi:hypothetical protein
MGRPPRASPTTGASEAERVSTCSHAAKDRIRASNLTPHELFQKQTTAMLDRADLDDEQKQSILIAMSCPCCGAGGMSFTAKLKR